MILRIARKDKTGLLTVSKAWYELVGQDENGKPIYELRTPEYNENPSVYQKNIDSFEKRMQELAELCNVNKLYLSQQNNYLCIEHE